MRKIATRQNEQNRATIYYNPEFQEYRVKFHTGAHYHEESDYFTDDKIDAIKTAEYQIQNLKG